MRMRYSPTNPLSPGTPIDDSITTMNPAAKIGATCLDALQVGDLAGVAALVDHPTRRNSAPVEMPWLIICSTPPVIDCEVMREHAEHDEAEVGDRRVGDEAFEVLLHRGHDRAVDDADHGRA